MVIDCRHVWREISNYIENDISPELRAEIDEHLSQCRNCTAVLDGAHNVILLIGDQRAFPLPVGFSARLQEKLRQEIAG
jgi:predicted anti-sigma-YlaC factor YlaD